MRRRWTAVLLMGAAALALAVTGCTNAPSPTASASTQNGVAALNAAAAKTRGQSYQFATSYGTTLTGEGVSSGDGSATSKMVTFSDASSGVVVKINALVLKTAAYAKLDLGAAAGALIGISPNTWVHIDPAKAPGAARLGIAPGKDIFGPDTYLAAVTTATVDSPTQVSGTMDLSKATLPGLALTALGSTSPPPSIPFTATLDSQGRIAKIVVKVPAIGTAVPAADLTTSYSNWGATVDATPPPANQTVEAPALVYTFLQ
jgi:hypothetical protein